MNEDLRLPRTYRILFTEANRNSTSKGVKVIRQVREKSRLKEERNADGVS